MLAASAGCFGSAAHATSGASATSSGISGTLRLVGGPAPGVRRLTHAKVDVLAGERVVATMTTDGRGRFRLTLPPGRYRFALEGGHDSFRPRRSSPKRRTTHVSLTLDAK